VSTGAVAQVSHATYPVMSGAGDIALSGDGSRVSWVEWAGWPLLKTFDYSTERTRDLGYPMSEGRKKLHTEARRFAGACIALRERVETIMLR
jgi:hypothetical protein